MNALLGRQMHMCACGLLMRQIGTTGYYMCVGNCDTVQDREHIPNTVRITTERDKIFNTEWKKRMRSIYDGIAN